MKHLNKKEIKIFANKYFIGFEKDIHSVSYFIYDKKNRISSKWALFISKRTSLIASLFLMVIFTKYTYKV